jgi:hypothetical protein
MSTKFVVLLIVLCFAACTRVGTQTNNPSPIGPGPAPQTIEKITNSAKIVHVLVVLCDNENQGIVPVPAHLGNGEDPNKNLYWGAAYGVKTYFGKSRNWEKLATVAAPKENVLERVVFKHKTTNVYLVADAYRGSKMKETIDDFFAAVSGAKLENVAVGEQNIQVLGSADVVAFVGHNGLMDFELEREIVKKDEAKREAIILACASRRYFAGHLKKTSARPLLWTTNLMAPEAYILHDALDGWIAGETDSQIQLRAAAAYAKFQRISVKSAGKLLVTGW